MSNYKVTLKTNTGETTYVTQWQSIKQVSYEVEKSLNNSSVVYQYTIEQQPALNIDKTAFGGLLDASIGLVACIVVLFVAEYKLRMMFKA